MGELVHLDERRQRRRRQAVAQPARGKLYVDLADPFSYLAAERVERLLPQISWRLASQAALERHTPVDDVELDGLRAAAERRAAQLRLPLQWPDRFPLPVPAAMRAAAYAIEAGRGGAFILAAGRLAFCGGFDLDEPDVLMEAAAAAGISLDDCLQAAGQPGRDASIEAAGRRLLSLGADRVPALTVSGSLLSGEGRISAFLLSCAQAAALPGS
jgi:2-hydroxychromene-2-carboxylate isomerase